MRTNYGLINVKRIVIVCSDFAKESIKALVVTSDLHNFAIFRVKIGVKVPIFVFLGQNCSYFFLKFSSNFHCFLGR